MRGTTHAVIGANTVWIPVALGITVQPWMILVGAFVALLPDLDASESKIKNLKFGGYIGRTRINFKPFVFIASVISVLFRHRGALHSLLFVVLLAFLTGIFMPAIPLIYWWIIFLSYISHLVLDALTKSGIELFWPLRKRVGLLPKPLRVKTGGLVDTLLFIAGVFGIIIFLYQSLYILI